MNTLVLKSPARPVYQLQPQASHPRLSLTRVIWERFLKWISKASPQAIWKALRRFATLLLVSLAVLAPQFLLGLLTASAKWHGARIPLFLGLLYATLNAKRLWSFATFKRPKGSAGNQYLYHGLPPSELASFLKETGAFKKDEAMKTFRISEDKWKEIAEELEEKQVLTRGEKNARVLRPISYVNLVRQLSEKFPLIWDPEREIFVDRDGQFARWTLANEFKQRRLEEKTGRKERKLDRLQEKIEEAQTHPIFTGALV